MTQPGHIEFRTAEEPVAGPGEILLRIKKIGVCGSDIHVWHGEHPYTPYPVIQGHEFSAVVEALNRAGERLKRDVNPVVMTSVAFEAKLVSRDRFVTRVAREPKIFLLGDAGEFSRDVFAELREGMTALAKTRHGKPAVRAKKSI